MSNRVIRLGGSHIDNPTSLYNLKNYLLKTSERKFVVVSAIPELLDIIENSLDTIFENSIVVNELPEKLNRFNPGTNGGAKFNELVDELTGLLKGVSLIGDFSRALKDQVLSFAEKLSVELLQAQWEEAVVLNPGSIDLKASEDYGNASFESVNKEKLASLAEGVYIVPGTFGITQSGKTARTGRTSADYTAAFLTQELGVEKLELWGLDWDFQRANPEIIDNLPTIDRLTYAEASELAYFEHYSFHPRTVEPLEQKHIPIVVVKPDSDEGLTDTIINTETFIEEQIVKSVACSDDISLLKLDGPGVGLKPGILAKVTTRLNEAGLNIKSVITSQTSINFLLSKSNGEKALKLVNKLGFSSVTEISVVKDISLIGVVGHGMQQAYGVSAKIFTAVANNKINVVLSGSGASDLVSYLIVSKSDKEKSVREIYKAFF